jgi:hypothetical protein
MAAHRLPFAALGFAIAAALSSWNPLSAPFGVVVGLAAAGLALRASLVPARRPVALTALCVALGAAIVSGAVLARTAGVGRGGPGQSIVTAPSGEDVAAELDQAAERTRAARERASGELQTLEKGEPVAPGSAPETPGRGATTPAPDGAGRR